MYAAGILPVCFDAHGQLLFLVGREHRDNTFSDWGGRMETRDAARMWAHLGLPHSPPISTALREFWEESLGLATSASQEQLRARLTPSNSVLLVSETLNRHAYYCFIIQLDYQPALRPYFARTVSFLRGRSLTKLLEKTECEYMTLTELYAANKRQVFAGTLQRHRALFEKLASSRPETWRTLCAENAHVWETALGIRTGGAAVGDKEEEMEKTKIKTCTGAAHHHGTETARVKAPDK